MNRFFEEYSWTLLAILGGIQGIHILFEFFFGKESVFKGVLTIVLESLMS